MIGLKNGLGFPGRDHSHRSRSGQILLGGSAYSDSYSDSNYPGHRLPLRRHPYKRNPQPGLATSCPKHQSSPEPKSARVLFLVNMALPSTATAHLRIARPTNDLKALLPFYCDGLGFKFLLSFPEHEGFEGILLGHTGFGYHLEFTRNPQHDAGRSPTQDNLLVFYLPDHAGYQEAVSRMETAGFSAVKSFNPYWDRYGKTYEDPDGYRAVLANRESPV